MSDFEDVLERLLSDPSFRSALASDPQAALAGYTLADDERELLSAQLVSGPGGDRLVETRTTKSGVVGLLGPVAAAFGVASGGSTGGQSMGAAPGTESFGPRGGSESFGASDGDGRPSETFGTAGGPGSSLGSAPEAPKGASLGGAPTEAADYRTWVDVDGDGSWDQNRAYERADGGVDIHVDLNRDGVADFVGHDYDRDGLVDSAEFDDDSDGTMDRRMHDDTGDGWMDREEPIRRPNEGFGQAPGR